MDNVITSEIPFISLSLLDDDFVCLYRGVGVSDLQWSVLTGWWHESCANVTSTDSTLNVPLICFNRFKLWLRTHWENLGYRCELTPALTDAVKKIMLDTRLFSDLLDNVTEAPIYDLSSLRLKRKLTDFQTDNVHRLLRMPNGANFSVPGAGKTTTTLVVWAALRKSNKVNRLLVIGPRSAFEAWHEDTLATFTNEYITSELTQAPIDLSTDILIVNYEQLQNRNKLARLCDWVAKNDAMLVIDEAHRIKGGAMSVRWRGVQEISTIAKRVDLLTGTPMPQGFSDLKNLYSISWPTIPSNQFSDENLRNARRGGVFVRTTKTELGLPEPILLDVPIPMGEIQSQIYSALRRTYSGSLALNANDESFMNRKGTAVLTLIAVATNPGLLSEIRTEDSFMGLEWPPREFGFDEKLLDIIANYAAHEIPAKYTWVSKYVHKAASENRKVLVWSNFVGNLLALNKVLKPYSPALIFGGIDNESRKNEITRFRNDPACNVLLTNPQTLGEGVSLHHACHDAIYVDRTYNAGLYLQSLDRIHRLGLAKDQETRIFVLNTERSIDHRVSLSLGTKIERMGNALNDPGLVESTLPVDLDDALPEQIVGMDKFDLDELYAHLSIDT